MSNLLDMLGWGDMVILRKDIAPISAKLLFLLLIFGYIGAKISVSLRVKTGGPNVGQINILK